MGTIKTAISLEKSLFEQIETLAREMKVPRSRVFALALEDFIRRRQNQRLLDEINAAYDDIPDKSEEVLRRAMRRQHRRMVEGQW